MSPPSRLRFFPSAIPFYTHPFITANRCIRKPGVGFECDGRRLLGVTEYLRRNFYPTFKATRRATPNRSRTQPHSRGLGMRMGSIADHAITAFAKTGDLRKMTRSSAAQRLVHFLKINKLTIVDAHVLICDPSVGIATEIDVLCQGKSSLVVIENKTTLQSRTEHLRTYRTPDSEQPLLAGPLRTLLNNEYNHHQLQLALMLIMLKQTYNIRATGYVVMATVDGLIHYPINPTVFELTRSLLANQRHFRSPAYRQQLVCHDDPSILRLPYSYRPFLRTNSLPYYTAGTPLPPILLKFLKKVKITTPQLQYTAGTLKFYDRPDVTEPIVADVYAETTDTIYIFALRATPFSPVQVADPISAPVKGVKILPGGYSNTLLSAIFLELAITTAVLQATTPLKQIQSRVILLPDNAPPFSRKLPTTYIKKITRLNPKA